MATLKERYVTDAVPKLKTELGQSNVMEVPRLIKVVLNIGVGVKDKDVFQNHVEELAKISGQKPLVTKARKSISNFKLREGMPIGAKVTLRGSRMYEFLERLITAGLPRIRDFRGLSNHGFDGRGNYTFGIKEQTVFPEIDPNHIGSLQGMNITLVTTARTNEEARHLLKALGMPFMEK